MYGNGYQATAGAKPWERDTHQLWNAVRDIQNQLKGIAEAVLRIESMEAANAQLLSALEPLFKDMQDRLDRQGNRLAQIDVILQEHGIRLSAIEGRLTIVERR